MRRGILGGGLLVALGLSLILGVASWAKPNEMGGPQAHWGDRGHQGRFANLTPEQVGQLFDLRQKFLDDSASLRKEMAIKRAELRLLWRSENPDEKQILAKLKEINAIRDKLQPKFVALRLEVRKLLPKGPSPQGKVSMEEEPTNVNPIFCMESGDQTDW